MLCRTRMPMDHLSARHRLVASIGFWTGVRQ
jgi:hypothetical protein